MDLSSITLLIFAATVLFVLGVGSLAYDCFWRYRLQVRERVQELTAPNARDYDVQLFKGIRRLDEMDAKDRTMRARLSGLLNEAGIACSLRSFAAWCACMGIGCGAVGVWLRGWAGLIFLPIGAIVPLAIVRLRRNRRRATLSKQLPEAFQMISRAVRAGQTVPSALKIIADDFEPPICEEFALCYEEQNLGLSREASLRKFARRTGIMELQIFVVALLVQARTGGNLVELLDNLALTVRKRTKLSDRVRALTGEGRMQARVLLILPVAALAGLMVLSPEYAAGVTQWPWLLVATAAAQAVGAFWIRKIINFQY